jgi:hypothetical protein
MQSYWKDASGDHENIAWLSRLYEIMHGGNSPVPRERWSGYYIDYPDRDLDQLKLYYGENLPRVLELKARYGPRKIFMPPPFAEKRGTTQRGG